MICGDCRCHPPDMEIWGVLQMTLVVAKVMCKARQGKSIGNWACNAAVVLRYLCTLSMVTFPALLPVSLPPPPVEDLKRCKLTVPGWDNRHNHVLVYFAI